MSHSPPQLRDDNEELESKIQELEAKLDVYEKQGDVKVSKSCFECLRVDCFKVRPNGTEQTIVFRGFTRPNMLLLYLFANDVGLTREH